MEKSDISSYVWNTKIPIKLKINYSYLACDNEPPLLYVIFGKKLENHFFLANGQ